MEIGMREIRIEILSWNHDEIWIIKCYNYNNNNVWYNNLKSELSDNKIK